MRGLFLREVRVEVPFVEVLRDAEATVIDVEVDVATLVVGRDELPVRGFGKSVEGGRSARV